MIVPPDVLRQIEGQALSPNAALRCQPSFQIAPEPFPAIDIVPRSITEALTMVHKAMDVASCRHPRVAFEAVRAHDGSGLHPTFQQRQQGFRLHVRQYLDPGLSTTSQDPEDRLLGRATSPFGSLSPLALRQLRVSAVVPFGYAQQLSWLSRMMELRRPG